MIVEAYHNLFMCEDKHGPDGFDAVVLLAAPGEDEQAQAQPVGWCKPPAGTIKINFDASVRQLQGYGFGMVVRNSRGQVLAVATEVMRADTSPLLAELLCYRCAMG